MKKLGKSGRPRKLAHEIRSRRVTAVLSRDEAKDLESIAELRGQDSLSMTLRQLIQEAAKKLARRR